MQISTLAMLKSALFEATFVVLGVLLALSANEWREHVNRQENSEQAVAFIKQELERNKQRVSASLDYHIQLRNKLYKSPSPLSIESFPKGFVNPAAVSRTAWQTASETGALESTDFNTVFTLSNAYALQTRYEAQSASIGAILYEKLLNGGTGAIVNKHHNLAALIASLAYKEQQLLAQYEETSSALLLRANKSSRLNND